MKAKLFDKDMVLVKEIADFTCRFPTPPEEFGTYEWGNDAQMLKNQDIIMDEAKYNPMRARKFKVTFYHYVGIHDNTLIYMRGRKGRIGVKQYDKINTKDDES